MRRLKRKTAAVAVGSQNGHVVYSTLRPLCVTVNEAADMLSIGRTKLYQLMNDGVLGTVKVGKSTRVTMESLEAFVMRGC
jgi:excisionase family DNA binding protein